MGPREARWGGSKGGGIGSARAPAAGLPVDNFSTLMALPKLLLPDLRLSCGRSTTGQERGRG